MFFYLVRSAAKPATSVVCGLAFALSWLVLFLGIIDLLNPIISPRYAAIRTLTIGIFGTVASASIGVTILMPKRRVAGISALLLPVIASSIAIAFAPAAWTGISVVCSILVGGVVGVLIVSIASAKQVVTEASNDTKI